MIRLIFFYILLAALTTSLCLWLWFDPAANSLHWYGRTCATTAIAMAGFILAIIAFAIFNDEI